MTVDDFLDLCEPVKGNMDISSDIGEKIKRPKLDPVPSHDISILNKMRKNEVADHSKAAESTTSKDILSDIHSIDQLKDFLNRIKESLEKKLYTKTEPR